MKRYHLIGIGGTGLSAIARLLFEEGYIVTGSDTMLSPFARELQALGVKVTISHNAKNINSADFVIRSSAIAEDNVEIIAARAKGIPVFKRADFLDELTRGKIVIAIAGTHGKTTTTSMMAWTLTNIGEQPSYIIGGVSKNLKANAHAGQGKYFVIEADEYDGMFLGLKPDILIITNIEHDHPDFYPTPELYFNAFRELVSQVKTGGSVLICIDHPGANRLIQFISPNIHVYTYGTDPQADFIASEIQQKSYFTQFSVIQPDVLNTLNVSLKVSGVHNVLNALSVIAACNLLKLDGKKVQQSIEEFIGTSRRFEIIGVANGVTIIDDYGHHPTEIMATLASARLRFPGQKLWVVWQPHTYSRTQTLLNDFIAAFKDCDHVILTEIYRSREKAREFSSAEVVRLMEHPDARFIPDFSSIVDDLYQKLKPGDVLIVFSAGDANQICTKLLARLQKKEKKGIKNG